MRKLFTLLLTTGLVLCASRAEACYVPRAMQPQDYAMADVIFEGTIKEVFPVKKYNDYLEYDQVVAAKLKFSVDKTLRGDLPQKKVLVGYSPYSQGAPGSVKDFVKWHGETVRVGLITPEHYGKFCKEKMQESWRGGKMIEQERTDCEFGLPEYTVGVEGVPFIQGAPCANSFIFDLSKPVAINSRDFLSKKRTIPIDIFRENQEFFHSNLTAESPEMASLIEMGIAEYEGTMIHWQQSENEKREYLEHMKVHLQKEFLAFASLEELDPALRERLLRDDLSNTEH